MLIDQNKDKNIGGLYIKEHATAVWILKTYGCNVKIYIKDSNFH